MDDEKLIEIVKRNSVLYDMTHRKYTDPKYKMAVWESIGAEMNMSASQCKSRWVNIRDHFRRHLIRRMAKTEQGSKKITRYKYESLLQFILPYSNDPDKLIDISNQGDPIEADVTRRGTDSNDVGHFAFSLRSKRSRSRSPDCRSQNSPTHSDASLISPAIRSVNVSTVQEEQNDIDAFLVGIASTMKKLNPYNQHIAKGQIFNIVHELESQELFRKYQGEPDTASEDLNLLSPKREMEQ